MKPYDKLKELGFSDEELKNFFQKQKKYSEKVNQIKRFKDNFGITTHTPAYTPETLVNRIYLGNQSNTEKHLLKKDNEVKKLSKDFNILEKIEKEQKTELQSYEEGVPYEMKETIKEFLDTLNNFASVDTSMDMVNEIIDKNKNNLQDLFNEVNDILDILYSYAGAKNYTDRETGEVLYYQPNLNNAISRALSLIYS